LPVRSQQAKEGGGEEAPTQNERLRREPDNFKFLNDLSINHSSKFFNEK
jgi:hypothetical protein